MRRRRLGAGLLLAGGLLGCLGYPGRALPAGDPERGAALFSGKQCARCHAPRGQAGVGPAIEELRRPQGAFELAGRLWNHVPAMFATLADQGVDWPTLEAGEMADLMAYLQADPARDPAPSRSRGEAALVSKGCLKCHRFRGEGARIGPELAERRPAYESAVAWAAAMWVHTPRMAVRAREMGILYPRFTGDDLAHLVGFLKSPAK